MSNHKNIEHLTLKWNEIKENFLLVKRPKNICLGNFSRKIWNNLYFVIGLFQGFCFNLLLMPQRISFNIGICSRKNKNINTISHLNTIKNNLTLTQSPLNIDINKMIIDGHFIYINLINEQWTLKYLWCEYIETVLQSYTKTQLTFAKNFNKKIQIPIGSST